MFENLLKKINWSFGRREGGYKIKRLFQSEKLKMDCYLLYYTTGDTIAPHTDPVKEGKHYRLNVELIKAKEGGEFQLNGKPKFKLLRAVCFSPSEQEHSVTKIKKGYRLILSIGWIK